MMRRNLFKTCSRGLRFIARDVDPEADTCVDYVADVMPGLPEAAPLFPLKPLRTWQLSEAVARFTVRGTSLETVSRELRNWAMGQAKLLEQKAEYRIPVVFVDELFFDPLHRRWWQSDRARDFGVLFNALREGGQDAWERLARHFEWSPGRVYADAVIDRKPEGLPLAPIAAPLPDYPPVRPEAAGYWNLEHALLPARDFISRFVADRNVAEAARTIVLMTADPGARVVHTGLVRPPHEWVAVLVRNASWAQGHAIETAEGLSECVTEAGLSPLESPRPLVAPYTTLDELMELAGSEFLTPQLGGMMKSAGVKTVRDLKQSPGRLLRKVPIMPRDVRMIGRTMKALGHAYAYGVEDVRSPETGEEV